LFFQSKNPNRKNQIVNVREAFEAALKRAEIDNFTWHDLRHTAASYLAMNGATQGELMTFLGHNSPVMTKRYAHFSQEHLASVMSRSSKKILN
jgi:integrase